MAPEASALASFPLTHTARSPYSGAALQNVATDVISGPLPGLMEVYYHDETAALAVICSWQ